MAVQTLVVEITHSNGSTLEPIYECHGLDKFFEFVEWHKANLSTGSTALLKGYDYNTDTPEITYLVSR
jgi:hypothetical protein